MKLLILLQTGINDISWRTTDVVFVVSAVITILGAYFYMKYRIEKVSDKNDSEHELTNQKQNNLEKELDSMRKDFELLEQNIGKKLDEVTVGLNKMAVGFESFKTDIYKIMLNKGQKQ